MFATALSTTSIRASNSNKTVDSEQVADPIDLDAYFAELDENGSYPVALLALEMADDIDLEMECY